MRSTLLYLAKLIILLLVLLWLYRSFPAEHWETLKNQPKRWEWLGIAFMVILASNLLSFWRWRRLVLSLGQPFSLANAVRLGFLGCLFNLVSVGSVGGDLFKALAAARLCRGRRPEVAGSVLVDRALGLFGLLIVSTCSLLLLPTAPLAETFRWITAGSAFAVAVGTVSLTLVIVAGRHLPLKTLNRLPWVGHTFYRMAHAGLIFDRRPKLVLELVATSCLVHIGLAFSVYILSMALYASTPTVAEHFLVIPPAFAAGSLPLTPAGLGVQEAAVNELFQLLGTLPTGFSGMVPAVMYRFMTFLLAAIGGIYYFLGHDDVQAVQSDLHRDSHPKNVSKPDSAQLHTPNEPSPPT